jgi:hypothetical protein
MLGERSRHRHYKDPTGKLISQIDILTTLQLNHIYFSIKVFNYLYMLLKTRVSRMQELLESTILVAI